MYFDIFNHVLETSQGRFNNIDTAWRNALNQARTDGHKTITLDFTPNQVAIKAADGSTLYTAKELQSKANRAPSTALKAPAFKFRGCPNLAGWYRSGVVDISTDAVAQLLGTAPPQTYYLVGMDAAYQPTEHQEIPGVQAIARKRIAAMPGKKNTSINLSDIAIELLQPTLAKKNESTVAWFVFGFIDGAWKMAGKRYA